ncbi:hypothetical protein DID88_008412 [Monilinia fructigena]|uniref:Uncharacterized protein n=1 Tax=Monilinia fructigena TaxID=38457 RepID=A0A395J697_9HELO|nr:hypothetical protein DID88_008412 [Monilinia fructigena]
MMKSLYNAVSQIPFSPGAPLTPVTSQYSESYPLTARDSSPYDPKLHHGNGYDSRSNEESCTQSENSSTPLTGAQLTNLLHEDLIKQDQVRKGPILDPEAWTGTVGLQKLKNLIRIRRFISRALITAVTIAINLRRRKDASEIPRHPRRYPKSSWVTSASWSLGSSGTDLVSCSSFLHGCDHR